MNISKMLEKLDASDFEMVSVSQLREILLAGKEPTLEYTWMDDIGNRLMRLEANNGSKLRNAIYKIEDLEKRVAELEKWASHFINFEDEQRKKDALAVEPLTPDCMCGHPHNSHLDIEDGTIKGQWGMGRCDHCKCGHYKPEPKAVELPMDGLALTCTCPDADEPHRHNVPHDINPTGNQTHICMGEKCIVCGKGSVKPTTPLAEEQTLDTRKEWAFIERVWMEGDSRPYGDMKKAVEKLIEKYRSHSDPSTIRIDRKVAEDWLRYIGHSACDGYIKPCGKMNDAIKNALEEGK